MQLRKKKPEKFRISKLKTMGKQISIQTSLIYLNMVTTVFMHLQAEGAFLPFYQQTLLDQPFVVSAGELKTST